MEHANLARKRISPSHLVPMGIYDVKESQKLGRDKALEMKMQKHLNRAILYRIFSRNTKLENRLVRWIDPEEGMIYPDEFINLF